MMAVGVLWPCAGGPWVTAPTVRTCPLMVVPSGRVTCTGSPWWGALPGVRSAVTAIIPVTVSLDSYRPPADLDQAPVQVTITEQADPDVLAVPVTALLAQPGGGYAVRTTAHRLIPVGVGIYDDTTGLVEVGGGGLAAGMTVQVAQG